MLVKNDFITKVVRTRLGSNSSTSLVNEIKSFVVYSLLIIDLKNLSQNFANLSVGVPITDKIGQNVGIQL